MNETQRSALKRYHGRLAEDLLVTEALLADMYQAGIFEQTMLQIIRVRFFICLTFYLNTDKLCKMATSYYQ